MKLLMWVLFFVSFVLSTIALGYCSLVEYSETMALGGVVGAIFTAFFMMVVILNSQSKEG